MTSHCKLDTTRPFMSDIATPTLFLKIQLHHATDVNRGLVVKNILCLELRREISKQDDIERRARTENGIPVCSFNTVGPLS